MASPRHILLSTLLLGLTYHILRHPQNKYLHFLRPIAIETPVKTLRHKVIKSRIAAKPSGKAIFMRPRIPTVEVSWSFRLGSIGPVTFSDVMRSARLCAAGLMVGLRVVNLYIIIATFRDNTAGPTDRVKLSNSIWG